MATFPKNLEVPNSKEEAYQAYKDLATKNVGNNIARTIGAFVISSFYGWLASITKCWSVGLMGGIMGVLFGLSGLYDQYKSVTFFDKVKDPMDFMLVDNINFLQVGYDFGQIPELNGASTEFPEEFSLMTNLINAILDFRLYQDAFSKSIDKYRSGI